jgi:hypothetical protein
MACAEAKEKVKLPLLTGNPCLVTDCLKMQSAEIVRCVIGATRVNRHSLVCERVGDWLRVRMGIVGLGGCGVRYSHSVQRVASHAVARSR